MKYGILGDLHVPYHDPKAVELVLAAFKEVDVDCILINGDFLDFYNINSHSKKDPRVKTSLEDEFHSGLEMMKIIRENFPTKKIIFNAGNHEYRLDRFIIQNCPQTWNLLTLENQLMFDRLDVEYYPYNTAIELDGTGLFVQHSPPSYSIAGPRQSLLKKTNASYIWGCTHRVGHSTYTDSFGAVHQGWFNGWLGTTTLTEEHVRVFSYAKGHENWQQSAMIVETYNGNYYSSLFTIESDYSARVEGQIFKLAAKDGGDLVEGESEELPPLPRL